MVYGLEGEAEDNRPSNGGQERLEHLVQLITDEQQGAESKQRAQLRPQQEGHPASTPTEGAHFIQWRIPSCGRLSGLDPEWVARADRPCGLFPALSALPNFRHATAELHGCQTDGILDSPTHRMFSALLHVAATYVRSHNVIVSRTCRIGTSFKGARDEMC